MDDLTLHSRVPRDHRNAPTRLCVWCGKPTPVMALTPFRPDLGALPLHLFCGAFMQIAYRTWQEGGELDADDLASMARLAALPQLGAGE